MNEHVMGLGRIAFDSNDPMRRPTDPETGEPLPMPKFAADGDDAEEDARSMLKNLLHFKALYGGDAVSSLLERANRLMAPRGVGANEAGMSPRGTSTAMGPRGGLAGDSKPGDYAAMKAAGARITPANGGRSMSDAEFAEYRRALRAP